MFMLCDNSSVTTVSTNQTEVKFMHKEMLLLLKLCKASKDIKRQFRVCCAAVVKAAT